jgi:ribonucleoside-diphosphate reductase alpha chain
VTRLINTGCGKLYVTVNQDDLGFCEVFAQMGKTGGCASSQIESTGRLISLALRSGVKMDAIIKQITGIRCPQLHLAERPPGALLPGRHRPDPGPGGGDPPAPPSAAMGACPDCGGAVEHEGGCLVCRACGFSKCN